MAGSFAFKSNAAAIASLAGTLGRREIQAKIHTITRGTPPAARALHGMPAPATAGGYFSASAASTSRGFHTPAAPPAGLASVASPRRRAAHPRGSGFKRLTPKP